jgi:hypothetical protein
LLAANFSLRSVFLLVLPAWLPYAFFGAAFIILPVVLRLFADDMPRNEEKPADEDERDPGPSAVPVAA